MTLNRRMMNGLACAWALAVLAPPCIGAAASAPVDAVVFPFQLLDTSPDAGTGNAAADQARLPLLDAQLRLLLEKHDFRPIDAAASMKDLAGQNLLTCNGCDLDLAATLGGQVSVVAWVQKVSQLIININVTIRSVPGGKVLHGASVDIRGDTDTSFSRGLDYLFADRLFQ